LQLLKTSFVLIPFLVRTELALLKLCGLKNLFRVFLQILKITCNVLAFNIVYVYEYRQPAGKKV